MYIQWCWILIFVSIMTVASITFNPICVLVPGDLPTWRVLTFLRYLWCFLSRGYYTSELFPMLEFMIHLYQYTVRNSFKCDLNRDKVISQRSLFMLNVFYGQVVIEYFILLLNSIFLMTNNRASVRNLNWSEWFPIIPGHFSCKDYIYLISM